MAEGKYYVALPFVADNDDVAAGEPTECFNPNALVMRAGALSRTACIAVPFVPVVTYPALRFVARSGLAAFFFSATRFPSIGKSISF
jgi:hypothetical protein